MWQFWVEIVLGALLLVRVGHAQMHEYLIHHCIAHEPKSFVLQHFEHGNALLECWNVGGSVDISPDFTDVGGSVDVSPNFTDVGGSVDVSSNFMDAGGSVGVSSDFMDVGESVDVSLDFMGG